MKSLSELSRGEIGQVIELPSDDVVKKRLLSTGIHLGCHIRKEYGGSLGGPVCFSSKHRMMSIRQVTADKIIVVQL